jgi:hypothetical protein
MAIKTHKTAPNPAAIICPIAAPWAFAIGIRTSKQTIWVTKHEPATATI